MAIQIEKFYRRLSLISSFIVLVIGIFGIFGWITGFYLVQKIPQIVPISPVAAVAYVFLGSIMLIAAIPLKNKYVEWGAKFVCSFVMTVGCFFWVCAAFFPTLDIQKIIVVPLLGSSTTVETDIAPLAAFAIFLATIALVRIQYHWIKLRHYDTVMGILSVVVFSIGFLSLMGYAFGTPEFYGEMVRSISLQSSMALVFLGIGIMAINGPSKWPSSVFSGNGISSQMIRILIPILVFSFLTYSWILYVVIIPSFVDPVTLVAAFTALSIATVAYTVSYVSTSVQKIVEKAQKERLESIDALEKANEKLDILDSLTRHDVLNQVSVAIVEAQLLKGTSEDQQVRESAENIENINRTIIGMLQFSKEYRHVGVEKPIWIDVKDVISRAAIQIGATKGKVIDSYCTGWRIFADPMVSKAFFNILENSIRHGEHVTNMTIECAPRTEDGTLKIVFSDNGAGIPEAEKERIFQKGVGKNTGLGLFLVREILSITGISIKENGVPGKGARFEITVPKGKFEAIPQPRGTGE